MPDRTVLAAMTEHVRYEWKQLCRAAHLLRDNHAANEAERCPKGRWCCYVESFAIHVRNAIEFFCVSKPRTSDVRAEHYVASGAQWLTSSRESVGGVLSAAYIRANKQIAHLTVDRASETADFNWPVDELMAELDKKLTAFKAALDPAWNEEFDSLEPFTRPSATPPMVYGAKQPTMLDPSRATIVSTPGTSGIKLTAKSAPD